MNKKERKRIEARLHEERARALEALRRAQEEEQVPPGEQAGEVARWYTHPADAAWELEEQERDFMVAETASRVLRQIDAALELLYRDPKAFDRCERCGKPIELERFEVVPWTRVCAACARVGGD